MSTLDKLVERLSSPPPSGPSMGRGSLGVGQSAFTEHLKLHHYRGSLLITEMQHAGKRGKKVHELTLIPKGNDEHAAKVIGQAVNTIWSLTYSGAKGRLESILRSPGNEHLFTLHEQTKRGIDVEPMATTIHLKKKFPDETIVEITASPYEFLVKSSALIHAPGKAAHGWRQDTLYSSRSKDSGARFYAWIKNNMGRASNMTILDLTHIWRNLDVRYDFH